MVGSRVGGRCMGFGAKRREFFWEMPLDCPFFGGGPPRGGGAGLGGWGENPHLGGGLQKKPGSDRPTAGPCAHPFPPAAAQQLGRALPGNFLGRIKESKHPHRQGGPPHRPPTAGNGEPDWGVGGGAAAPSKHATRPGPSRTTRRLWRRRSAPKAFYIYVYRYV